MHKLKFRIFNTVAALALSAALFAGSFPFGSVQANNEKTTDKTANEVVEDMTVGWNIGNTLDASGKTVPATSSNETAWGNPEVTPELIQSVGAAGFNTIRIPVSWGQYTTGDNYQIPEFWMSRVKEVVDYCIDNDMYVILNSHHDTNYYSPTNEKKEESEKYFDSIWTQIATEFKDYDSHLVFETMNEPRLVGHSDEWWFPRNNPSDDVKEAISCINDFNQVALDAIRATGGNNATRCVMVPGYDASYDGCMIDSFKLPNDSAKNRLIVSVHAYTPYDFTLNSNGTDQFTDKASLDSLFSDLGSKYLSQGTPVVIGEMGASNKNNTEERVKWADYYWSLSSKYKNIAMCLWDNNILSDPTNPGECHRYIDRNSFEWMFPDIINTIMKYVDGTPAKSATGDAPTPIPTTAATEKPIVDSGRAGEIVRDMTAGWNLGNTLDVVGDASSYPFNASIETYWGNPLTTQAMIDEVAKAGFNTVRIPVSWGQYTTGDNYEIPDWWMDHVKEVVDYAVKNDMYVILDSHHDIGDKCTFYYPDNEHKDESIKFLTSIWTQIAEEFKDYNDKLIFETMNEPRLVGTDVEWWFPRNNPGDKIIEAAKCINAYNQAVVDAVRKTGGNNADRCIMVSGYDTSIDGAMMDAFKLPEDTADNRIIMAIHAYTPYYFALDTSNPTEEFDTADIGQIDDLFSDIDKKFVSQGVPVIISETGCLKRANNHDDRIKWVNYYWGLAEKLNDVACVLWDNNVFDSYGSNLGYLNRETLQWDDQEFIDAIMNNVNGTVAPVDPTPTPVVPVDPTPTPVPPETSLKVIPTLNDWDSGFQYQIEVKNEGPTVTTWEIRVKKSDITIDNSWCVTIEEDGDDYVITPLSWNSRIEKGQSITFGLQGTGKNHADQVEFTIK